MTEMMRRRSNTAQPKEQDDSGDRERVLTALENHGSMTEAAASLGVSRQTLWRKMKKYGISR